MGRPKIKIIDDSQSKDVKKPAKKPGRRDELVERLKAELADEKTTTSKPAKPEVIEVARGDSEKGIPTRSRSERLASEDARRDIEPAGPRAKTKVHQPSKSKPRSKKYQEAVKDLDRSKTYPINEAIDLVKKVSYSKFTGTLEAHINTIQAGIRGLVSLPYVSGKKLRILVFPSVIPSGTRNLPSAEDPSLVAADDTIIIGNDATIEEINKGKVNFDLVVTSPDWMGKLAKVARILGPRGLMPNPKNNTIVPSADGLKKAVESFQTGKTEYKTEAKNPLIHLALGKLNQPNEELAANIKTLIQTVGKTKIKKVTLSPTMGPGIKLDLSSL